DEQLTTNRAGQFSCDHLLRHDQSYLHTTCIFCRKKNQQIVRKTDNFSLCRVLWKIIEITPTVLFKSSTLSKLYTTTTTTTTTKTNRITNQHQHHYHCFTGASMIFFCLNATKTDNKQQSEMINSTKMMSGWIIVGQN
ncbi:conserved hypothetical protein, partial [Trichinella spiralis]|uniref:hypothetical protein n=1 Tax=Trichinella spiralis TaxID=6334 RepID=UPI0001EFD680